MITLKKVSFDYTIFEKSPGFKGTLRDFFKRRINTISAIKSLDLKINTGEVIGLIGPNGAGKTTLTKLLTGIIAPSEGEIKIDEFVPSQHSNNLLKNIGVMFGQKTQLSWNLPPVDTFNMLSAIYQLDIDKYKERLAQLIDLLDIGDIIKVPVRKLSLGQRVKCELVCALIHSPKYLFLDEPTLGLDILTQDVIYKFLLEENKLNNTTIIFTSHNLRDIEAISHRLLLLAKGTIIFDGPLNALPVNIQSHQNFKLKYLNRDKVVVENIVQSSELKKKLSSIDKDDIISVNRQGMTVDELILSIYKTLE